MPSSHKVPLCSQTALNEVVVKVPSVADLGVYEHIGRSCAVDGDGLCAIVDVLEGLVQMNPGMEFNFSQLKAAYMNLVFTKPKVNTSKYPNKVWAGLKSERLITVLYHVRRVVRNDKRLQQMLGKMRAEAFDMLQDKVLCKVVLTEDSCVDIPLGQRGSEVIEGYGSGQSWKIKTNL